MSRIHNTCFDERRAAVCVPAMIPLAKSMGSNLKKINIEPLFHLIILTCRQTVFWPAPGRLPPCPARQAWGDWTGDPKENSSGKCQEKYSEGCSKVQWPAESWRSREEDCKFCQWGYKHGLGFPQVDSKLYLHHGKRLFSKLKFYLKVDGSDCA